MTHESKSRYAVLGLLAWRPMSGYDIKKTIAGSLGYFWSESYGQIYPILKELAAEGMVIKRIEHHDGKPDRHVYTITDKGLDAFRGWMIEPAEVEKERIEVLLKLFYGYQVPVSESIGQVRRFREQHHARRAHYDTIAHEIRTGYEGDPGVPFWLVTLRCGMLVSEAFISWCDEAEETLSRMAAEGEA